MNYVKFHPVLQGAYRDNIETGFKKCRGTESRYEIRAHDCFQQPKLQDDVKRLFSCNYIQTKEKTEIVGLASLLPHSILHTLQQVVE